VSHWKLWNILAAYYAIRCGLPVSRLICASNRNKVLTEFIRTGCMIGGGNFQDRIALHGYLISSNLERLLFELSGRKADVVAQWMKELGAQGGIKSISGIGGTPEIVLWSFADKANARGHPVGLREAGIFDGHPYGVGYSVLQKYREETGDNTPALLASTASPFKFNRRYWKPWGGTLLERTNSPCWMSFQPSAAAGPGQAG